MKAVSRRATARPLSPVRPMPTTAVPPILTTLVGCLAEAVPRRAGTTLIELLLGGSETLDSSHYPAKLLDGALTEADAHLGLANRLAAPFARRVFLAYEISGRKGAKYRVTGRPVPAEHRGVSHERIEGNCLTRTDVDCAAR